MVDGKNGCGWEKDRNKSITQYYPSYEEKKKSYIVLETNLMQE